MNTRTTLLMAAVAVFILNTSLYSHSTIVIDNKSNQPLAALVIKKDISSIRTIKTKSGNPLEMGHLLILTLESGDKVSVTAPNGAELFSHTVTPESPAGLNVDIDASGAVSVKRPRIHAGMIGVHHETRPSRPEPQMYWNYPNYFYEG